MLTAERVLETFTYCLYNGDEPELEGLEKGQLPEGAVPAAGIVNKVAFNPNYLEEKKPLIKELVQELPLPFFKKEHGGGDGQSFLNMCVDRHGNHWGEHVNVQELMQLGLAAGFMEMPLPDQELWVLLPGGMPYLTVTIEPKEDVS